MGQFDSAAARVIGERSIGVGFGRELSRTEIPPTARAIDHPRRATANSARAARASLAGLSARPVSSAWARSAYAWAWVRAYSSESWRVSQATSASRAVAGLATSAVRNALRSRSSRASRAWIKGSVILRLARSVPSDLPVADSLPSRSKQVVGDLEGDAEVAAEGGEASHRLFVAAGVVGAQLAAAGAELGRLGFDDGEVVVFGEVHVAAGDGLSQLAVADDVGGPADRAAGVGALERAGEVEGVGEEEVAQQDAGLVVPAGVDGVFMAADGGFVEHVVVHERGGVDHLDDGGERDVLVAQGADRLAGQQQQGRAEPLAARGGCRGG